MYEKIKQACLSHPPATPNGELQSAFWRGYAYEASGIGQPFDRGHDRGGAFDTGREHRRNGGTIPDAVRRSLPALFADIK
jgi:hypothetical protein